MSEQWEPKADDFRQVWAAFNGYGGLVARPHSASWDEAYAEFDRWLEGERRAARAEAYAHGYKRGYSDCLRGLPCTTVPNPYETGDRHVDQ